MKQWLKDSLPYIILIVCVSAIIYFIFHKGKSSDDLNAYKIEQLNEQLKIVLHERDSIQKELDITQDSVVNHIDSLLHVQGETQNKILNELNKKRETISVPNYGSDTLRYYFSRLRPIYHDLHTQ